jgi:hypothetical protein
MMKKFGVVLFTIIACLIMLEFSLRAIGRRPTNMADGTAEQFGDSFRLKENAAKVIRYPAFTYTVYTNEFGFRDRSTGPKELKGRPFYAFLGASDVFGNGVEYEDSFVGIFAEEAKKKGMEVVNLAVGGYGFLDQEDLLKKFMEDSGHKPAAVLFCVNALHIPGFDKRSRNIIVKSGYPIDRDGWRITYLRLLAGNISSAFCFFRDGIRRIQEKYLNYQVSSKSPPEFIWVYSRANSIRNPERTKAFEENLAGFEAFCRQNEIDLIYVHLPLSDSFRLNDILKQIGANPDDYDESFYEKLMRSHCEKFGMKLVDLNPVLQQHYNEGRELRFKLDPHFNVFGNRVIGEYLARAIL